MSDIPANSGGDTPTRSGAPRGKRHSAEFKAPEAKADLGPTILDDGGSEHDHADHPAKASQSGKKRSASPRQHAHNGSSASGSQHSPRAGKREKVANGSGRQTQVSNGHGLRKVLPPLTTPSGFQLDGHDVVRLMVQTLSSMGFSRIAEELEEESGVHLESRLIRQFREAVLNGDWPQAIEGAAALHIPNAKDRDAVICLLHEQRYLEMLESGDTAEAISCLRMELVPRLSDQAKIQHLSSLLVYGNPEEVRAAANWDGKGGMSRQILLSKIQDVCPPSLLMPRNRLLTLLDQAVQHQVAACQFHDNSSTQDTTISLLTDHTCTIGQIPDKTLFVLDQHADEILHIAFSRDGKYLASASKDGNVIIWDTLTRPFTILHVLRHRVAADGVSEDKKETEGPIISPSASSVAQGVSLLAGSSPLSSMRSTTNNQDSPSGTGHLLVDGEFHPEFVAWSPDSTMLLTCGTSNRVFLWDAQTGKQKRVFSAHSEPVSSVAWMPDGKSFVSGGLDKSVIVQTIDGRESHRWTGEMVQDLAVSSDGKRVVVATTRKNIAVYNMVTHKKDLTISEDCLISSICLSADGFSLLVNVANPSIHSRSSEQDVRLWDLRHNPREPLRRYHGSKQGRFCVRSVFGGAAETFVASGSEDSQIYIWHRHSGELLSVLSGHAGAVGSVAWSPTDASLLVTGSDDRTLRVWSVKDQSRGSRPAASPTSSKHSSQLLSPSSSSRMAPGFVAAVSVSPAPDDTTSAAEDSARQPPSSPHARLAYLSRSLGRTPADIVSSMLNPSAILRQVRRMHAHGSSSSSHRRGDDEDSSDSGSQEF